MKEKEKEYLVAFKLYIEHYDPRYRYPKWIKATSRKDAVTQYMRIIKPDVTLGACIIIDERPVKQDENEAEHDKETGLREYTGDLSHYSGLTEEEGNMKESIVKGERTEEKESIDMIMHVPRFDIICAGIRLYFPYILEIDNTTTGVSEKHVIVITNITENCINCNQWDDINDDPHSDIVLSPFEFYERNGKLYKITGEDLK